MHGTEPDTPEEKQSELRGEDGAACAHLRTRARVCVCVGVQGAEEGSGISAGPEGCAWAPSNIRVSFPEKASRLSVPSFHHHL